LEEEIMSKTTLYCILGALVAGGALSIPASASTLLHPLGTTRVVGPGDSWRPPPSERQVEILDRLSSTRRYASLETGSLYRVQGRAERRTFRQASWKVSLEGDRARIHEELGRPTYRWYEVRAGHEREFWTYPESHRTYVFKDHTLVATRYY
jgi:hypothetical protein